MPLLIILILYSLYISLNNFFYFDIINDVNTEVVKLHVIYILISVTYLIVKRRKNILCPELIISITFYIATYLLSFSDILEFQSYYVFKAPVMLQSIALATLGWTVFIIGALLSAENKKQKYVRFNYKNVHKNRNLFLWTTFSSLILMIAIDGSFLFGKYSDEKVVGQRTGLISYMLILLIITSFYEFQRLKMLDVKTFKNFYKKIYKPYIIIFFFISGLLIYTGDRSSAMQILLPFLMLYYLFINKIKSSSLAFITIVGLILFVFVRENRGSTENSSINYFKFSELIMDFVPANAAIPTIINYTDTHGLTMGSNIVYNLLAIVPFLQSYIISGVEIKSSSASSLITSQEILGSDFHSGQGTHVVADLYYTFGFVGVIIGMCLAGFIYSRYFNKILKNRNIGRYQLIFFLVLFGNIIFFVRVEYFFILQNLSFAVIFTYLGNVFVRIKN